MWSVSIFYCRLFFCILDYFLKCSAFELVKSHFTFSYLYCCHCMPETTTQANIQETFFSLYFSFLWVLRCQVFNQLWMDFRFQCCSSEYRYLVFLALLFHVYSWNYCHGGFKYLMCLSLEFLLFHSSTYSNTETTQIWLLQLCSVEWIRKCGIFSPVHLTQYWLAPLGSCALVLYINYMIIFIRLWKTLLEL